MLTLENVGISLGGFSLTANWIVPTLTRVGVIGPSGGGKSTLLLAIAGFLPLQSGRILWHGRDLAPLAPGQRPLTMLFQEENLFPHLTLAQNLGLGLDPGLKLSPLQRELIETTLTRVGLNGMGARKPGTLSGGQQARAALARALLRARPLLLLDEPFSALGPALKSEMLDLVQQTASEIGATVLMVTHVPADARRIADQTILVADGAAHPPQPTDDLFANPPAALRDYLGS